VSDETFDEVFLPLSLERAIQQEAEARHERDWADAHRRHGLTIDRLHAAVTRAERAEAEVARLRAALENIRDASMPEISHEADFATLQAAAEYALNEQGPRS
jgi:hypothetical protein